MAVFRHTLSVVMVFFMSAWATESRAQGIHEFFQKGQTSTYAPVDTVPLVDTPNPDEPNTEKKEPLKEATSAQKQTAPLSKAALAKAKKEAAKAEAAKAAAVKRKPAEEQEDEDEEALFEHEEPKRVTIALPPSRPGGSVRLASEVAPIGKARWSSGKEQLPPGVDFREAAKLPPNPALLGSTRVASLPQVPSTPRWTSSDIQPLRPEGLRQSETPVANMPGVYAPPEANFQCLPSGVKQVLLDTAKRFGHVAILNAKRPRGTGARQSYHYQCRAVDFRVRGVAVRTVYNFLKEHPNVGGRKIYPFGFFHVDDGPSRSW